MKHAVCLLSLDLEKELNVDLSSAHPSLCSHFSLFSVTGIALLLLVGSILVGALVLASMGASWRDVKLAIPVLYYSHYQAPFTDFSSALSPQ